MQATQIQAIKHLKNDVEKDDPIYIFCWKRRHNKNFKTWMSRLPDGFPMSSLRDDINYLESIKAKSTLKKFQIIFGADEGQKRWDNKKSTAVTLEVLKSKYGDDEGQKRWDSYREKQAHTNTFEYKRKIHGMTAEDFKKYNKSRAATLENFKRRHGDEEGEKRWKSYCERQSYTNTIEHLGEDRYREVNKMKARTLSNFQRKYGEELGSIKYKEYVKRAGNAFYSKESLELFDILSNMSPFNNFKCYYATNNGEYGIMHEDTYFKYDFVVPELKLCVEYNGDHYHGNPSKYKENEFLKGRGQSNKTAGEAWEFDKIKNQALTRLRNYDIIVVWQGDWYENREAVINKIKNYAKDRI